MKKLTEFEQNVCNIYANFHTIPLSEIEWAFTKLRSFDKTLLVIQMVNVFNISLKQAVELVII